MWYIFGMDCFVVLSQCNAEFAKRLLNDGAVKMIVDSKVRKRMENGHYNWTSGKSVK